MEYIFWKLSKGIQETSKNGISVKGEDALEA
jgi:hypothetical protein